jgi:penicillin-binding protein 1A
LVPAEIDAGEAPLLAGINANATHYSPRRYPERALGRRKFVLDQMHAKGFITEQYYKELSARPLTIVPQVDTQNTLAPEAVAVARDVMTEAQKTSASQGGFSVTTTIRPGPAGRGARRRAQGALGVRRPARALAAVQQELDQGVGQAPARYAEGRRGQGR